MPLKATIYHMYGGGGGIRGGGRQAQGEWGWGKKKGGEIGGDR